MNAAQKVRTFDSSRRAFTLVELLIVIIIIGILAGAMLLVVGSGEDKADATVIVNDLRAMKAAALMFYTDNPNRDFSLIVGDNSIKLIEKLMDRTMDEDRFLFYILPNTHSWSTEPFVWYVFRNLVDGTTEGCRKKLADMAKDTALLGFDAVSEGDDRFYVASDELVGLRVK